MRNERTNELDAVNEMLSRLGFAPINSLKDKMSTDATSARATLRTVNREVQAEGWMFNTFKRELVPDENGDIYVTVDTLDIDAFGVMLLGEKLYDRINGTDKFKNSVKCKVVILLDFEKLPEPARRYIIARATRIFVDNKAKDGNLHEINLRDEIEARARLCAFYRIDNDYTLEERIFTDLSGWGNDPQRRIF